MKRPYLQAFLLIAIVVLNVGRVTWCQNGDNLEPGPSFSSDDPFICQDIAPTLYWFPQQNRQENEGENQTIAYQIKVSKLSNNEVVYQSEPIITNVGEYRLPICFLDSVETKYYCKLRKVKVKENYFVQTTEEINEEYIVPISKWGAAKEFRASSKCKYGTTDDTDCDGIPDIVEKENLGTNPDKKTLFVRPKEQNDEGDYEYWENFIDLFHKGIEDCEDCKDAKRHGFVIIPPFENAGIEVVVIGEFAPERKYKPFNSLTYDPAKSDDHLKLAGKKLPCDIMEIRLIKEKEKEPIPEEKTYSTCYSDLTSYTNDGHIYLAGLRTLLNKVSITASNWRCDGKGLTFTKCPHRYHVARLFELPLDKYFEEGAYRKIEIGDMALENITDCNQSPAVCSNDKLSPMNLKDPEVINESLKSPFIGIPVHTPEIDTVEFTPFTFDEYGKVTYVPSEIRFDKKLGKAFEIRKSENTGNNHSDFVIVRPYTKKEVKKRNIVHEMGHALMGGGDTDHCYNPKCIMHAYPLDWELRDFGPPCGIDKNGKKFYCCEHKSCGGLDVRAGVYNTVH